MAARPLTLDEHTELGIHLAAAVEHLHAVSAALVRADMSATDPAFARGAVATESLRQLRVELAELARVQLPNLRDRDRAALYFPLAEPTA